MPVRLTRTILATALLAAGTAVSAPLAAQKAPPAKAPRQTPGTKPGAQKPAPQTAGPKDDAYSLGDVKEVENYRLTPSTFGKLVQVQENMYAMLKANPNLGKKYAQEGEGDGDEDEPTQSLTAMAQKLDKVPEMKQAISKAGLTTRQYLIASMAMLQAAMADAVMQIPGADKSRVPANVQANAAFLRAHKAEMDRMNARMRELQKLSRPEEPAESDSSEQEPDTTGAKPR